MPKSPGALTSTRSSGGQPSASRHRPALTRSEAFVQAGQMMAVRLAGGAIEDIAADFGVDPKTVYRRLQLIRQSEVLDQARSVAVTDMLPRSLAVMQEALEGENLELAVKVASKIIDGLKALEGSVPGHTPGTTVEETFEAFRSKRVVRVTGATPDGGPGPLQLDSVIEAIPVDALPRSDVRLDTPAESESSGPTSTGPDAGGAGTSSLPLRPSQSLGPPPPSASDSPPTGPTGDDSVPPRDLGGVPCPRCGASLPFASATCLCGSLA